MFFRQCHRISMSTFRHNLRKYLFIKSPGATVGVLYKQYGVLVNKENALYFRDVTFENGHDSKQLWQVPSKAPQMIPEKFFLFLNMRNYWLISLFLFFSEKISKIRETFSNADCFRKLSLNLQKILLFGSLAQFSFL